MNLYLFNDTDSAAVYGIGSYLKELTRALEGSAVNVHIVHLRSVHPKFKIENTNNVENWYIPEVSYDNMYLDAIQETEEYYRNVIYILRLYIKDTKDLIFHFNYNNCLSLAKRLKEVFNCKTVAVIHYVKWQLELLGNLNMLRMIKTKPQSQRNSSEKMIYMSFEYECALFKEVDRVIVLSRNMQDILISEYQLGTNKISVIPNGLEHRPTGNPIRDKQALRQKYNIPDVPIILFVGRLDDIKGLKYALRAFKILYRTLRSHFIVVGNGNFDVYMKECEEICMNVTWTGLIDKKLLYDFYSIADIGVMPSLYEQCSYVAIEMMMHELPIVATATSGLNEIVDDTCGLRVPISQLSNRIEIDITLLAEKMLYLLQHPSKARKMGQNGRKRYLKKYASKVFHRNMLNFYCSLIYDDINFSKTTKPN